MSVTRQFEQQWRPFGAGSIDRGVVLLFVGWALGILSSPITDAIRGDPRSAA